MAILIKCIEVNAQLWWRRWRCCRRKQEVYATNVLILIFKTRKNRIRGIVRLRAVDFVSDRLQCCGPISCDYRAESATTLRIEQTERRTNTIGNCYVLGIRLQRDRNLVRVGLCCLSRLAENRRN